MTSLTGLSNPIAQAAVPAPGGTWQTAFSDDFSGAAGTGLNTSNWLYDTGTSYAGGAANWGTNEVETATNSTANVYEDGQGHLEIKPIRDAAGNWTSGRVETQRSNFAAPVGGKLELTASIEQPNPTNGVGYWLAFWALGAAARPVAATNWPSIGELDTLEDVNGLSQVSHTFHCGVWGQPPCNEPTGIGSGLLPCAGCQTAYHTYSVIVDRTNASNEQITFYTDGISQFNVQESQVGSAIWSAAVDHGFYMILDVAIGGSYPDKVCNCTSANASPTSGAAMSVDYVAAYTQSPGSTTTAKPTTTTTTVPKGFSATSTIQAEAYSSQSGTESEPTTDTGGGSDVGWINNCNYLRFNNVIFGTTPLSQFKIRAASGAAAGTSGAIEAHLDSLTGPAIGTFDVANTDGWQSWQTLQTNMAATTGTHTVYLKFLSGSPNDFVNVNWFTFAKQDCLLS